MSNLEVKSLMMSISGDKLDCNDIINYLHKSKIMASVSKNKSIVRNKNIYTVENGCRIIFNKMDKQTLEHTVWKSIKKNNNLVCAHIYAPGVFNGCIYDFIEPSKCP
jgi:hypothetical protein